MDLEFVLMQSLFIFGLDCSQEKLKVVERRERCEVLGFFPLL